MKLLAYIFFIGLFLLLGVWLLLPYIMRFFLKRFEKKMREYQGIDQQETDEEQEQSVVTPRTDTQAEQTDFEELN